MKCTIPEISWHNREPVLSVDINPISSETYRLATSGGDSHVLIWQMSLSENGAVKQELISDLTRHQRAVNVVRWSPSGQYLASADDDANIIIWQLKTDNIPLLEGDTGDKEIWIVCKILRGHKEDIYDLCWSVNGLKLLSGSIDNTAILWDFPKGKMDHILVDHKGFVQGVAWDPKDQLITTISTDRICRIFSTNGKHVKARIHKGRLPVPSNHYLYQKDVKYFHDDTFKSFFRRLQFSPEGSLLVVPSGHVELDDCKKTLNATFVFTFENLNEPVAVLPLTKQCSTAVKFCPLLFELREDCPHPIIDLPYRMIFAISTDHDVILYDTQQTVPFARFQEIHYTRLTDLTWSCDGRLLIASSTDGFCALITFDVDELGVPYIREESEGEDNPMDISGCQELGGDEIEDIDREEASTAGKSNEKKRPSFIEQWAIKTPKKIKLGQEDNKVPVELIEISDDENDVKELPNEIREEIKELIPRRSASRVESAKVKENKRIAKPIAVRRKPKSKEGANPTEVRQKQRDTRGNSFKENTPLNQATGAKTEQAGRSETKENQDGETLLEEKTLLDCESEIIETNDHGRVNSPVNRDRPTETKSSQKKENIKVSPLVKKRKNSPQKESPLLRFLKCSLEGSKETAKKGVPSSIDLTLAEEEARDAWKCEKDLKEGDCRGSSNSNVQRTEEDCTEDFCLQLEDSQESERRNIEPGGERIHLAHSSKSSGMPEETKQKVPRRVTLITLSSPKGKKTQKP